VTPPRTYAEWSAALDALERGDDLEAVILAIEQGEVAWVRGVAEPLSRRFDAVLTAHLSRLSDRLRAELGRALDPIAVGRALLSTRSSLSLWHRIALAPPLPLTLRDHLLTMLDDYASRAQDSLEQSAREDRSGQLAGVVRAHDLRRFRESATGLSQALNLLPGGSATALGKPSPSNSKRAVRQILR
jgi:hypothetical protein